MKMILPLLAGFLVLFVGIYISGKTALYEDVPYFDSIMHVLGGVAVGWAYLAYASYRGRPTPSLGSVLVVTIIVGLLWELAEYISGITTKGTVIYKYFHGGGRIDSISDLAMDILGAVIAFIAHPKKLDSFKSLDS